MTMSIELPMPYQEDDRWDRSRCTCKIFVLESIEWNVRNVNGQVCLDDPHSPMFKYFEHLATHGSNKTFEPLGEGLRVIAEMKKEVVIGEKMLLVDVEIQKEDLEPYELP